VNFIYIDIDKSWPPGVSIYTAFDFSIPTLAAAARLHGLHGGGRGRGTGRGGWRGEGNVPGAALATKVIVHLPNTKVGQVLTPTPIPLPLPRVGGQNGLRATLWPQTTHTAASKQSEARMSIGKNYRYQWAQGNFVASNHPHSCEQAK
jgi:hypothetical protein